MEYLIFHEYDGTWVLHGKYLLCHSNRVYRSVELKDPFCQVEKRHVLIQGVLEAIVYCFLSFDEAVKRLCIMVVLVCFS